ncbi:hypothetical protein Tco_0562202 [Tanacetum coccineum]
MTATVRTLANGTQELVASIDNHEYIITEASVRSKLQLADATGINNLPDAEIYAGLTTLGPKSGGWDQFGSPIATALTWNHVPLLPAMMAGAAQDQGEGSAIRAEPQHTPIDPVSSTQPKIPSTSEPSLSSPTSVEVEAEGATTIIPSLDAGLDSGNIHESPLRSNEAPIPEGHISGSAEDSLKLKELSALVPKLELKIDNLEKEPNETKQTLGSVVLTLVKKVKSLEVALKRKKKKMIVSDSEDKETDAADFITPSNLGEAQEKDISPTTMEATRTLAQVAFEGVRTYKRRTKSTNKGKNINTGLDAKAAINNGSSQVKSGSANLNAHKGQREGKAPITV